MGANNTREELVEAIKQAERVAVIAHSRPDGDAVGSTLALAAALRDLGKDVQAWNEDGVPERYNFLDGADRVTPPPALRSDGARCLICLDSGEPKRLGDAGRHLVETAPLSINIDHHETNTRYATLNLVEGQAAACACVLLPLLDALGARLTRSVAEALYVAISTDTGSFQYDSTTAEVMRMGARLIDAGVDVGEVNRRMYQELPLSALSVQREVLSNMVVRDAGQVVHYTMTAECRAKLQLREQDTRDMVDIIRVLRGVKVAAIFEELDDGLVRVSLRSKDPAVRVSDIALQFGGGGHSMAAGIRVRGKPDEVCASVLSAISDTLKSAK